MCWQLVTHQRCSSLWSWTAPSTGLRVPLRDANQPPGKEPDDSLLWVGAASPFAPLRTGLLPASGCLPGGSR